MEQQQFDRLIREKLENLQPEFRADHWQRMQSAIHADEELEPLHAAETAFDREVLRQMRHFNVGAVPRHWARLRRRMEEALYLRRLILGSKVGEVVVLTLAILLFTQLPLSNPETQNAFPTPETKQEIRVPLKATSPSGTSNPVANTAKPAARLESFNYLNPGQDPVFSVDAPEVEIISHPNHTALSTLEAANVTLQGKSPDLKSASPQIEETQHKEAMANYYVFGNQLTPLANQRSKALLDRRLNVFEANALKPFRKKTILSAAMFGGPDYNHIMTPPNEETRTAAFSRYALGYGGGIIFSAERGRWELGSGLIYSSKPYQPRQIVKYQGSADQGYIASSFNQVDLDIIHIPFQARYNFYLHKRSRLYAVMGGSLQVAASAAYFITTTTSQGTPKPEMRSAFDNTSKGILEGGSVKENAYITGNFGLGVEHFMTDRWSVFAQPTYQHTLGHFSDGFGPGRDRINTLSLWTGIRIRIIQ
jgi:hypothetical protein